MANTASPGFRHEADVGVSVVIASKNRPDSLERAIRSLRRQDCQTFEIVVVDDGSTPPLATDLGSDVTVLRNEHSRGMCAARNRGISVARGELVLMLDDDVEIMDATLISRATALASRFPACAAIGFRQLTPKGVPSYMQPSAASVLCYAGQFFGYGHLLRADALRRVGTFEPAFGYYYEEIELSLRLLDAGYSIIYDPSLSVVHYEDQRGRDYSVISRMTLRNAILTALLRFPITLMPFGIAAPVVRHLKRTRAVGRADFRGISWAAGEVARLLGYTLQKRKTVRSATLWLKHNLTAKPVLVNQQ